MRNAVIYNTAKTKALLFSKSHCQELSKQLNKANLKVGNEYILFNKKTTSIA